jgi:nitroreductase
VTLDTNDLDDAVGFLHSLATTRAIRKFRPDPIPEADLATMFFAATRAPSASNRQNFRFVVLPAAAASPARAILGQEYRRCWSEKQERDGYAAAAKRPERPAAGRMVMAMQHFVDNFESIPVIVLACLIRYKEAGPLEGASVYPACQNLLLAARALGYGGVLTQWHTGVEDQLRDTLSIPPEVALAGVVALGKPMGRHGPVRRLPMSNTVFEGQWGSPAPWAEDPPGTAFTGAGPPAKTGPGST